MLHPRLNHITRKLDLVFEPRPDRRDMIQFMNDNRVLYKRSYYVRALWLLRRRGRVFSSHNYLFVKCYSVSVGRRTQRAVWIGYSGPLLSGTRSYYHSRITILWREGT